MGSCFMGTKLSALPAIQRLRDGGLLRVRDLEGIALSDETYDLNNNNDDNNKAKIAAV